MTEHLPACADVSFAIALGPGARSVHGTEPKVPDSCCGHCDRRCSRLHPGCCGHHHFYPHVRAFGTIVQLGTTGGVRCRRCAMWCVVCGARPRANVRGDHATVMSGVTGARADCAALFLVHRCKAAGFQPCDHVVPSHPTVVPSHPHPSPLHDALRAPHGPALVSHPTTPLRTIPGRLSHVPVETRGPSAPLTIARPGRTDPVATLAWSPDGCALAVGLAHGGLSVWSVFGARVMVAAGDAEETSLHAIYGVRAASWGMEGYRLVVAPSPRSDWALQPGDVFVYQFVKSTLTTNACGTNHFRVALQVRVRACVRVSSGKDMLVVGSWRHSTLVDPHIGACVTCHLRAEA